MVKDFGVRRTRRRARIALLGVMALLAVLVATVATVRPAIANGDGLPVLTAGFSVNPVMDSRKTRLDLVLERSDDTASIAGLGYVMTLPDGLFIADTFDGPACGGTVTATRAASTITLADGGMAAGVSDCTLSVWVKSLSSGVYEITGASAGAFTGGVHNGLGTLTLTVIAVLKVLPIFWSAGASVFEPFDLLVFVGRIGESAPTATSGHGFALTLPDGLTFVNAEPELYGCDSLTIALSNNDSTITVSDIGLPAEASTCQSLFSVVASRGGSYTLSNAAITSVTDLDPFLDEFCTDPESGEYCRPLEVEKAVQTIAFDPPADVSLSAGTVRPSAAATSGLPASFESRTPLACRAAGAVVTLVSVGTCTVTAGQAGNDTYRAVGEADEVTRSFEITSRLWRAQTITFAEPGPVSGAPGTVRLVAGASSGLPVTFAATPSATCTVDGPTLTLNAAGVCEVTATQPGSGDFLAAPAVTRTITVPATAQTIDFAQPGPVTPTTDTLTLAATASSQLPVAFAATPSATCTVDGPTLTLRAAGVCEVTASQPGDDRFMPAEPVVRSVTVRGTQTITVVRPGAVELSAGSLALLATASSGLPVSYSTATPRTCAVNGATLTLLAAGACVVTAMQVGDDAYLPAEWVEQTITITAPGLSDQTITFDQPGSVPVTSSAALTATASSGLAVTFTSGTPEICAAAGATLQPMTTGTCVITADQAGDDGFRPAEPVTRSIIITAQGAIQQTITFDRPGDVTLSAGSLSLIATASSSLTVTFSSGTPGVCTVDGNIVHLLTAGTCTITAAQGGDDSYSPAPSVDRSFEVGPPPVAPPGTGLTFTTDKGTITTAVPGQEIVFVGTGFAPYSTVVISIASDPVVLGSVVTDGNGSFSLRLTIPAGLDAGAHTVSARGVALDGTAVVRNLAITVADPGAAGGLAITGAAIITMILMGLSIAGTGAGLVAFTKPRCRRGGR